MNTASVLARWCAAALSILGLSAGVAAQCDFAWQPAVGPTVPQITCLVRAADGTVYAAGIFVSIGGVAASNIARWTGIGWQPLGQGVNGPVSAMAAAGDGVVVAGGFTTAGGAPALGIARWNGFAWSTLGNGLVEAASAVTATPGGDVFAIVTYGFQLRRYDGVSWLNVPFSGGPAYALATLPDGDVIVGGDFQPFGLMQYHAGTLSPIAGPPQARELLVTAAGTWFAATTFGSGQVLRRDGATWTSIGQTPAGEPAPYALAELPNGDLLVAGAFTQVSGVPARHLARWDGAAWHAFTTVPEDGAAWAIAASGSGEVFVGGPFTLIGTQSIPHIGRAVPTCPATAATFGAGCTGSAGPVALQASNLAWAGGTFRSTATGVPPLAWALHAVGTPIPPASLPLGAPGCRLFVSPILLDLLLPAGSSVEAMFAVPRTGSLVGQAVRTQVVVVERDASLALVRLTATNGLDLTIGGF